MSEHDFLNAYVVNFLSTNAATKFATTGEQVTEQPVQVAMHLALQAYHQYEATMREMTGRR
jgi:hypothetical protein